MGQKLEPHNDVMAPQLICELMRHHGIQSWQLSSSSLSAVRVNAAGWEQILFLGLEGIVGATI